jgi:thiamine-monophosphate kinase
MIIGGDTNAADDLIIDCIMAGFAYKIIRRNNAKEGDLVITTGLFGYTSIGLKILLEDAYAKNSLKRKAINSILMPKPRVEFLKIANYINASMDSSDGLASTLNELSIASNKRLIIDNIPSSSEVYEFASANNYDPEELIFDGGEEYEIVATLSEEYIGEVRKIVDIHIIGEVREGRGVYIKTNSRFKKLKRKGFIHLSNR